MEASRARQIKIYIGKHFRLFKTEKGWKVIIFAAIIAGLIFAIMSDMLFHNDTNTEMGLFTIISACIWVGIFNSIQSVCKERDIIKREHRGGLHISAYIISHMVYQSVISFVEAILFLICMIVFCETPDYSLVGNIYLEYFITFFLVIYASDVLALAISSIVKSPSTAMTVMPFLLIIQLLFAGVLFNLGDSIAMKTVAKMTISNWGLNAAGTSADYNSLDSYARQQINEDQIARGVKTVLENKVDESGNPILNEYYYNSDQEVLDKEIKSMVSDVMDESFKKGVVKKYEYTTGNLTKQWLALLVHIVCYAAIGIVALEFVDKDKR